MPGANNCQPKIYTPDKIVFQEKGWNKDTFRGIEMKFSTNRSSSLGAIQPNPNRGWEKGGGGGVCVTWKTDSNISLLLQRAKYSQK